MVNSEAIHSLFLLSKYFLSIYYVLGTVLGSKDPTSLNKMGKVPGTYHFKGRG